MTMLQRAVDAIAGHQAINLAGAGSISAIYESSPVGGPAVAGQPAYLNGVVSVRTGLSPLALLDVLKMIERDLGRVPGPRWGPRVIDLDLLLMADTLDEVALGEVTLGEVALDEVAIIHTARLTLPHPRLAQRRFVLEPLAQVAPNVIHPLEKCTIAHLRDRARRLLTDQRVKKVADRVSTCPALIATIK